MERFYKDLTEILDQMGYIVFCDVTDDYDICDYISDSLQFIDFIIHIEDYYKISLSDDFLNYSLLKSAKAFSFKLQDFLKNTNLSDRM